MKPRRILSSLMAVLILSMFVAPNLVATAANATNYSTTEASDFERNKELDIWIGDILRVVHDPILVWSEPDLTGHQLDLEPNESMTVSKIIGDVYAVKIPKVPSLYYTKFDPEQVELAYRSASRLVDAKKIKFHLDFAERYEIFSSMDETEVIGIIHKNQVIENFEVCSYEEGWIRIGENQYVNLGSYSGFMFEYDEDITTTSTTTTAKTTTTTAMTTTTTNVTEEPEITTTVVKTQYELNDIVVVKAPVEVYSLNNELIEEIVLNEYEGFKILGVEQSWYTVEVWDIEETLKVKITEENYEKFSLVYRENSSTTTTTTVATTTSNTSTTTSSTTTSATTTSETTTTPVTTTNIVTTPDIPVFESNSVLKFIGVSWGERAQKSLDGEPIAYFTPENPYVILGEYCDNGWYNIAGNGTYINILEKDEYLFEDITCSYETGKKLLFLGSEWNIRETADWGQNLTGDTYPGLTVATVLKTKGNWHYVLDECNLGGWIFVDPNIWVEYDSVVSEEELPTEPPVENPTDEPVKLPEETLFQAGDIVMVTSWDPWALRCGQDWSDEAVVARIATGNTIVIKQALNERWFIVEYQDNLYYINVPEGQEEWFEKIS